MSRYFNFMNGPGVLLVAVGIGLGYAARLVLGGLASDEPVRTFETPLNQPQLTEKVIDLPLIETTAVNSGHWHDDSGLVPPISITPVSISKQPSTFSRFEHGNSALFEPHGDQICASGCAVSRHPTGSLQPRRFHQLLKELEESPLNPSNDALEELLFFGSQTAALLDGVDVKSLSPERELLLREQLKLTHAKISIRVVDREGTVRTWTEPTTVPLDRRHVFEMQTDDLQPLVTSGTVKRVGLNYLWTRL